HSPFFSQPHFLFLFREALTFPPDATQLQLYIPTRSHCVFLRLGLTRLLHSIISLPITMVSRDTNAATLALSCQLSIGPPEICKVIFHSSISPLLCMMHLQEN